MSNIKYTISEESYDQLKDTCRGLYAYIFALDNARNNDSFQEASVRLFYILQEQMEQLINQMERINLPELLDRKIRQHMQQHNVSYQEAYNAISRK